MEYIYSQSETIQLESTGREKLLDGTLMLNAGYAVAQEATQMLQTTTGGSYGKKVGLIIGSGGNGGDGLCAAINLAKRGIKTYPLALNPHKLNPFAAQYFYQNKGTLVDRIPADCNLIIDAIFGLNSRPGLPELVQPYFCNKNTPILSIDIPSGVECDSGIYTDTAVTATTTITFSTKKPAHYLAANKCGQVIVAPIGLKVSPTKLVAFTDQDLQQHWPIPNFTDHKYSTGVTGIVAGSKKFPGAGVLTTHAAINSTSGAVKYIGKIPKIINTALPTALVFPHSESIAISKALTEFSNNITAWGIGPGLGTDKNALELLKIILAERKPTVIDADALTLLAEQPNLLTNYNQNIVLTPHAGEYAKLTGVKVGADKIKAAKTLAHQFQACVVLKGHTTVIADYYSRYTGLYLAQSSFAATPGTGDVLTGILSALLASGIPPFQAAGLAVTLHDKATNTAAQNAPTNADIITQNISTVLKTLLKDSKTD